MCAFGRPGAQKAPLASVWGGIKNRPRAQTAPFNKQAYNILYYTSLCSGRCSSSTCRAGRHRGRPPVAPRGAGVQLAARAHRGQPLPLRRQPRGAGATRCRAQRAGTTVNRGPTRTTCACTAGPQKCLLLWGPTARGGRTPRTAGKITHLIEGFYPVPAAGAGKSLLLRVRAQTAQVWACAHVTTTQNRPFWARS